MVKATTHQELTTELEAGQHLILADEPTGNLDSKTSAEIIHLFGQIHEAGNTVIVVTHEEEVAQYAHRIIWLKDGVIEKDNYNPSPTLPKEV